MYRAIKLNLSGDKLTYCAIEQNLSRVEIKCVMSCMGYGKNEIEILSSAANVNVKVLVCFFAKVRAWIDVHLW